MKAVRVRNRKFLIHPHTSNCELKGAVFNYTKKSNFDIDRKKSCTKKTVLQKQKNSVLSVHFSMWAIYTLAK